MKKLIALLLTLVLCLGLAACGAEPAGEPVPAPAPESESDAAPEAPAAEPVVITVGASPAPHAEILEAVKPVLAEQGITLEIVEFTDYVLPNEALEGGDIDANYFQHKPYLDWFNTEKGTNLVSAAAIHFEPLGIYPGKTATLEELADGMEIAIPNDGSNEARALMLLQSFGYIKLAEGAGFEATPKDIAENAKNIKFIETEAAQLPLVLQDVDFAVINGNYAISSGIADKVLVTESTDSESAQTYANIVAVRSGDESRPEIKALVAALQSETVRQFITDKYGISVVPMF